jgi:hypothetical protein
MNCKNCGTANIENAISCVNCGATLMQTNYSSSEINSNIKETSSSEITPGLNETQTTPINPPQPTRDDIRSIGELIQESFDILKINWLNYSLILLISTIGGELLTLIVQGKDSYVAGGGMNPESVNIFMPFVLLVFVVFMIFSSYIALSLSRSVFMAAEDRIESAAASLKYSARYFLPYFLITLILAFGVSLGLMALIVPGIILALMWSMVSPVFVIEEQHGINVFQRSKELVRGYMFKIFLKMFSLFLILFITAIFYSILAGFVVSILFPSGFAAYLLGLVLMFVVYMIGGSMFASFNYFIYKDLVEIKGQ